MLIKKSLGLAQSFFRKDHGLRLVDRVFDEASFMESIQHIPVEALPCTVSVMQGQVEKRQGHFINCVGIDIYDAPAAALRTHTQNRSRLARITSADLLQTNSLGFALWTSR